MDVSCGAEEYVSNAEGHSRVDVGCSAEEEYVSNAELKALIVQLMAKVEEQGAIIARLVSQTESKSEAPVVQAPKAIKPIVTLKVPDVSSPVPIAAATPVVIQAPVVHTDICCMPTKLGQPCKGRTVVTIDDKRYCAVHKPKQQGIRCEVAKKDGNACGNQPKYVVDGRMCCATHKGPYQAQMVMQRSASGQDTNVQTLSLTAEVAEIVLKQRADASAE